MVQDEIRNSDSITLMLDGWKNFNSEPIVNIVACLPKPLFIKSMMTGKESHTADNMKALLDKEIEKIGINRVVTGRVSVGRLNVFRTRPDPEVKTVFPTRFFPTLPK